MSRQFSRIRRQNTPNQQSGTMLQSLRNALDPVMISVPPAYSILATKAYIAERRFCSRPDSYGQLADCGHRSGADYAPKMLSLLTRAAWLQMRKAGSSQRLAPSG